MLLPDWAVLNAAIDWLAHGLLEPVLVADRPVHAGDHAHHHRGRHDLPAPRPGAPRDGPARHPFAFLPLLAVAGHRHGHQGMGRHPPQAPRQVRNRGRPAQPADPRHRNRALARRRAVPRGSQEQGNHGQVRPRHAQRLDRAQPVHPLQLAGRGPDADPERGPVRRHRPVGLGGADAVDPDHGRRHHQRHRPLLGLPQLRGAGRQHQHLALGPDHRWRRAAQQPPHLPDVGQVLGQEVRVRHRLGLHLADEQDRLGQGQEGAAQAAAGRHQAGGRREDAGGA